MFILLSMCHKVHRPRDSREGYFGRLRAWSRRRSEASSSVGAVWNREEVEEASLLPGALSRPAVVRAVSEWGHKETRGAPIIRATEISLAPHIAASANPLGVVPSCGLFPATRGNSQSPTLTHRLARQDPTVQPGGV